MKAVESRSPQVIKSGETRCSASIQIVEQHTTFCTLTHSHPHSLEQPELHSARRICRSSNLPTQRRHYHARGGASRKLRPIGQQQRQEILPSPPMALRGTKRAARAKPP